MCVLDARAERRLPRLEQGKGGQTAGGEVAEAGGDSMRGRQWLGEGLWNGEGSPATKS